MIVVAMAGWLAGEQRGRPGSEIHTHLHRSAIYPQRQHRSCPSVPLVFPPRQARDSTRPDIATEQGPALTYVCKHSGRPVHQQPSQRASRPSVRRSSGFCHGPDRQPIPPRARAFVSASVSVSVVSAGCRPCVRCSGRRGSGDPAKALCRSRSPPGGGGDARPIEADALVSARRLRPTAPRRPLAAVRGCGNSASERACVRAGRWRGEVQQPTSLAISL